MNQELFFWGILVGVLAGVLAGVVSLLFVEGMKKSNKTEVLKAVLKYEILYFQIPTLHLNLRRDAESQVFKKLNTTVYKTHISQIVELLSKEEALQLFAHYEEIEDLNIFADREDLQNSEEDRKRYWEKNALALGFAYGTIELLIGSHSLIKEMTKNFNTLQDNEKGLKSAANSLRENGFDGQADALDKLANEKSSKTYAWE